MSSVGSAHLIPALSIPGRQFRVLGEWRGLPTGGHRGSSSSMAPHKSAGAPPAAVNHVVYQAEDRRANWLLAVSELHFFKKIIWWQGVQRCFITRCQTW